MKIATGLKKKIELKHYFEKKTKYNAISTKIYFINSTCISMTSFRK